MSRQTKHGKLNTAARLAAAAVMALGIAATTGCRKKAEQEHKAEKSGKPQTAAQAAKSEAAKPACPEGMTTIPAGSFTMGCSPGDTLCRAGEQPKPARVLKQFCMSAHEVTQAEYQKKTGKNPSFFKQCGGGCPVEQTSWNDAAAYCKSIGGRLPTETEWEYAARGGAATPFYWGATADVSYAWYAANSSATTHPAATLKPNAYGLYDMLGNVWEWTGGEAGQGGFRPLRGGGFNNNEGLLRVSARDKSRPDTSNKFIGFRCAADVK